MQPRDRLTHIRTYRRLGTAGDIKSPNSKLPTTQSRENQVAFLHGTWVSNAENLVCGRFPRLFVGDLVLELHGYDTAMTCTHDPLDSRDPF